jgi:hypothetical protein
MEGTKLFILSFILVATLGLNTFAKEEVKKEIKSFSPKLVTELEIALQTEKEKQEQLSTENKTVSSNERNAVIHLGQKIILNKTKQTYTLALTKVDIQGCEIVNTSKEWSSRRISSSVDNTYNVDVARVHGFDTRQYIKFIVKSPAIDLATGKTISGDNINITIEKHIKMPNVSFKTEVAIFPNKIGKVFIKYDLGDGVSHYKTLTEIKCPSNKVISA